jgi:uncharacterized protein YbaR (Trm112 family)
MHILLTDVLTCPRCGPGFGLILLADRIDARRVLAGRLGCANCREQYAIRDGAVDLRMGAGGPAGPVAAAEEPAGVVPSTEATRLAALLGVAQGPAYVLLAGSSAGHAADLSSLLIDVEVIGLSREPGSEVSDRPGVSVVYGEAVPIATGRMHGVALTGERTDTLLEEAARVVRPTGRLLVDPAPADAEERLRAVGLRTVAKEGDVILSVRG